MTATNQYGQYTDSPVEKAWFLQFKVLFLKADHRKILNRQPKVYFTQLHDGTIVVFMPLDIKEMSN